MSTNPRKAAAALEWTPTGASVIQVVTPLGALDIVDLIAAHHEETWAVDVPFGWPDAFGALMSGRHDARLSAAVTPADHIWEKSRDA